MVPCFFGDGMSENALEIMGTEQVVDLRVGLVERGRFQPREMFEDEAMAATRLSIQQKGQKIAVIVRPILKQNPLYNPDWDEAHFELADGERRVRCCRDLGLPTVKAVVRDLSDEEMLDYTLTTNDSVPLNPMEKAKAFERLSAEFGKTQSEIAKSFNLKQQQVSEYLRLLELPKEIQHFTAQAVISVRHAREILKISDNETRIEICNKAISNNWSTQQLAKIIKQTLDKPLRKSRKTADREVIQIQDLSFENKHNQDVDKSEFRIFNQIDNILSKNYEKTDENSNNQSNFERYKQGLFQKSGQNLIWLRSSIAIFAQFNSFLLFGSPRKWLRFYLDQKPGLNQLSPEQYLAYFELSFLIPTLVLFVLYEILPIGALALGSVGCAALLLKVIEDQFRKF